MEMKIDLIALGAKQRDMTFSDGRNLKDCVVTTIDLAGGENEKGFHVDEIKGPFNIYDKFTEFPAKYDCSVNWDGKKMSLIDATYKESVILEI